MTLSTLTFGCGAGCPKSPPEPKRLLPTNYCCCVCAGGALARLLLPAKSKLFGTSLLTLAVTIFFWYCSTGGSTGLPC